MIEQKPISQQKECPFYLTMSGADSKECSCLLKRTLPHSTYEALLSEDKQREFSELVTLDCKGLFNKCAYVKTAWQTNVESASPINALISGFDVNSEKDTEIIRVSMKPAIDVATENKVFAKTDFNMVNLPYKVRTYQIEDPYKVKCDALFIPTDWLFNITDSALLQYDEHVHKRKISLPEYGVMDTIYLVQNGLGGMGAQHGIGYCVIGATGGTTTNLIASTVLKALLLAEKNQYSKIAFVPFDYGGMSVESTALIMLEVIFDFGKLKNVTSLKSIAILMQDSLTKEVFDQYMQRYYSLT